jgi:CBS domain-containing protein
MKVSDIMTRRVISVAPEATIFEAAHLMLKNHVSGLPVIGENGKLVGIVSEGDFLHRAETGTVRKRSALLDAFLGPESSAEAYMHSHGVKVHEIMAPKPISVSEDTPLDQVVHLMESHDVKRLPVLRDSKVVGIVSRANFMRALTILHRAVPASAKGDVAIRERILADIDKESWTAGVSVDATVHDGVVDLWGTVTEAAQEKALIVLAEAVPGVERVDTHFTVLGEPMYVS